MRLAWDPSPPSDSIETYRVYFGKASRDYSDVVEVSSDTPWADIPLPGAGVWFFAVTAVNAWIESSYSEEVVTNVWEGDRPSEPPLAEVGLTSISAPHDFKIEGRAVPGSAVLVEMSFDLKDWYPISTIVADATGDILVHQPVYGPRCYFRLRYS